MAGKQSNDYRSLRPAKDRVASEAVHHRLMSGGCSVHTGLGSSIFEAVAMRATLHMSTWSRAWYVQEMLWLL